MASEKVLEAPRWPAPPGLASDDFWDKNQWDVFWALMDSIVPSIVPKSSLADRLGQLGIPDAEYSTLAKTAHSAELEDNGTDSLGALMEERLSTTAPLRDLVVRMMAGLPVARRAALGNFLTSLSSKTGAFLITGSCVPFQQQPTHHREAAIRGWHNSWLPSMRKVSRALVRIAQLSWFMSSPMFRRVTGYPDVPVGWKPSPGFDFKFLQFPAQLSIDTGEDESDEKEKDTPATATIETDVVIVGSGCGGAVCAAILAEAGHRVLVVDKGHHYPPTRLPMTGSDALCHLFDRSVVSSADSSIGLISGSTWGGGGTINWGVSLRTTDAVRAEWSAQGLDMFETPAYDASMDRVCERMGVSTEPVVQTHRGQVLLEGARRLGWKAAVCPLNSAGKEHSCGHCTLGCGAGEKQGPAASWLPDAARAGAEFIEGFDVGRVLFEDDGVEGNKTATGVLGQWTSRDKQGGIGGSEGERPRVEVTVKAKRVIVACGALLSPILLMRSGLTNPQLGRNLRLHPCYGAGGFFDEETKPWEGAAITSYCTEFENMDGQGHGVKLETTNMIPFMCLPRSTLSRRGGLDVKLTALRYRHYDAFISVTRDRDSGRVLPDPVTGAPQVEYTPSAFDRAHALEGLLAICRILYAMKAREIRPLLSGVEPFVRQEAQPPHRAEETDGDEVQKAEGVNDKVAEAAEDAAFDAWLKDVKRLGSVAENAPCSSAHQMGTCRMGVSEDRGVVDPNGKVWGTDGLYVADSSVFPSASGVNPMVTVMAIADGIARAVDKGLRGGQ